MAVRVADTLGTMGQGGYPIVHAKDVDGLPKKLSEFDNDVGYIDDDDEMPFSDIKTAWDKLFNL